MNSSLPVRGRGCKVLPEWGVTAVRIMPEYQKFNLRTSRIATKLGPQNHWVAWAMNQPQKKTQFCSLIIMDISKLSRTIPVDFTCSKCRTTVKPCTEERRADEHQPGLSIWNQNISVLRFCRNKNIDLSTFKFGRSEGWKTPSRHARLERQQTVRHAVDQGRAQVCSN